jgi:hypothetical protein
MPNLGKKFECFSCRTKFYDLGKPEPVCPKCGANQKDAKPGEDAVGTREPRAKRLAPILVSPEEVNEFEEQPHEEEDLEHAGFGEEEGFDEDEEPPLETPGRDEEEEF